MPIDQQIIDMLLEQVQKPGRYIGGEINSVLKPLENIRLRFAFCFPDIYEVGMSHLGMKILYSLLNEQPHIACERVFAPWTDMEQQLRQHHVPLYALESLDPLSCFDIIGFTLQYELSYTNILNMLDLAGIPVHCDKRTTLFPLVIAGGPCACNPEPLTDFIDLFVLGEGEQVLCDLCDLCDQAKQQQWNKQEFLIKASDIQGVYVPSRYIVSYGKDGTVQQIAPLEDAPFPIKKRIVQELSSSFYPKQFIVPYLNTIHDRAMVELMRGCIHGCRFCQAGYLYRPMREKQADILCEQGKSLCETSGYEEISLCSLSSSDYSQLESLLDQLLEYTQNQHINLSLPSLRIDNFPKELVEKIVSIRKSGLTFAPEAGSQRMRDVINKNITEQDIFSSCKMAFESGYSSIKLYFMMGLPLETMEDCGEIIFLAQKLIGLYQTLTNRPKNKAVNITVSVSMFVPKPFTPFQWFGQNTVDEIEKKQQHLKSRISSKKIALKYHGSKTSLLEAVFARGDRRLGMVLWKAWKKGCCFDSWDEKFSFDTWQEAFKECNIDMDFYANRHRDLAEVLPWSHLDFGIDSNFLKQEWEKAQQGTTTPSCRLACSGCGANQMVEGGKCVK